MTGAASRLPPGESRKKSLALVCCVLWLGAAASAGTLGIWLALGSTAVTLGIAALVLDGAALAALLRPRRGLLALGVVAGGVMAVATYVLYPLVTHLVPAAIADTSRLYAAFRGPPPLVASLGLVLVILGEELVWRGVVQNALALRLGPGPGAALAAVLYALAHAPLGSPVLVTAAFGCGLAWGLLRAKTASLVPTLAAHLFWDLLVLVWLPLEAS